MYKNYKQSCTKLRAVLLSRNFVADVWAKGCKATGLKVQETSLIHLAVLGF